METLVKGVYKFNIFRLEALFVWWNGLLNIQLDVHI